MWLPGVSMIPISRPPNLAPMASAPAQSEIGCLYFRLGVVRISPNLVQVEFSSSVQSPIHFLWFENGLAEEPVGRLNIPGPSDRRPSPRARPPPARHSIDGQSPFTPRATPAPMPGSVALVRDHHAVARTRSQ